MKKIFLIVFMLGVLTAPAHASFFEFEKTKIKLSYSIDESSSSELESRKISGEFKWKTDEFKLWDHEVAFYSKPYYSYSRTKVIDSKEEVATFGFDVLKAQWKGKVVQPFFAFGLVQEETKITDSSGNEATSPTEDLTSYTYGVDLILSKNNGVSLNIYGKDKYDGILDEKVTDEYGVEITFDILEFFDKDD